jgi:outer membrane protein TolC
VSKIHSYWTAALAAALFSSPALAQEPSADRVRELIAQAAVQTGQQTPAPQSAQPNPTPGVLATAQQGPRVALTADDAVRRALERNLDLQVQRLTPQLQDLQVAGIWASYRPTLTGSLFSQNATNLPTSQLQAAGASRTQDEAVQWNSGVQQNVPWGGGNVNLRFNNTRSETTNPAATRNPGYTSQLLTTYTQPLLRNFRTDQTRSSLLIARIAQQIEDLNLRAAVTDTEAAVRNAYWDLVFAVQNVEAAQTSLDLASKLVQDNRSRVEIGTMAPIDVVQAQAEEATRRQALVTAQADRERASWP